MYSSYNRRVVASPSFKMLVAHPNKSSDPSKGEVGNSTPLRQVFETQVITTETGQGLLGNTQTKEASLRIKVESLDFGNANLGNAPPYYSPDSIQIVGGESYNIDRLNDLKAGTHFGRAEGEGVGSADDVAADLALILNDLKAGLRAEVDVNNANHVLVYSNGIFDNLFIKVYSYSYLLLAGDPPFVLEDMNGNVLYDPATAGSYNAFIRNGGLSPMDIS